MCVAEKNIPLLKKLQELRRNEKRLISRQPVTGKSKKCWCVVALSTTVIYVH